MGDKPKKQGDESQAFEDLVTQESPFITFALHAHGVCSRDRDDAAQEVLLVVHRRLSTFDAGRARDPRRAIHSWILSICQRVAASHRRRRARLAEDLTDQEDAPNEPLSVVSPAEQAWLQGESERLVWSLLDQIPEERAAVVRAYDLEETPMETVARTLGIPVNTGWNRRRLGLQDLRAALARRTATEVRASHFAAQSGAASLK